MHVYSDALPEANHAKLSTKLSKQKKKITWFLGLQHFRVQVKNDASCIPKKLNILCRSNLPAHRN